MDVRIRASFLNKSFIFDGRTEMSVERTSGVVGLKFLAYFSLFTNVTYCLSEDLPFGRSFILLRLGVGYSHTE